MRVSKMLSIVLVIAFAGGCLAADAVKTAPAAPPQPMPGKPGQMVMPPMPSAVKDANIPSDPNTVIVSYGDQKLTLKEMMYFLPEPKADYIQRMAQQWLDIQLLYDAAQKRGVTNDPKTKMMADLGYKQAFAREVMNKVANDVNIGDAQVQEYYDKNKNTDPMLFDPNLYSFTHIVVKTPAEANAVVTRIRAGEDPTKLAKDLSTAPDGKNGGSVKKLPEQMLARQYNDAFAKAVMSSSEGQVFGPIEVRGSYEVVRNEGKLSSKVKPLDDKLKQQIKMTLERKEKGGATEKFLQTLRDEAKKEGKVKMAPIAESKEVKPQ